MGIFKTMQPWKVMGIICLGLVALGNLHCAAPKSYNEDALSSRRFHVGYRVLDLELPYGDKDNTLTAAVWYPTAKAPKQHTYGGSTSGEVAIDATPYMERGPYPLLIFSHGYGGSGLSSVFFTEPLAAQGWIVVAPDHRDRHSAVRIHTGQKKNIDRVGLLKHAREISASGPEDRDAYLYRLDEMQYVLDWVLQSGPFAKLIDKEKIAVGGHSFGGFTALGLCGTIKDWQDDRIKGVLLFSTGAGGYLYRESELGAVKMPSMYFLGEREKSQKRGMKTMAELADKVYTNLSPPKYFLEVKGANHFSFNNRLSNTLGARFMSGAEEQFTLIRQYAITFLEKHIAGRNDNGRLLEQENGSLSRYSMETMPVR